MEKRVYNLEFEPYVYEYNILGYRFYRAEDYEDKFKTLQQLVNYTHEFDVNISSGNHAITSYVDIPEKELGPSLNWSGDTKRTALDDILLILSLFTGRDVFVVENNFDDKSFSIIADPRIYQWGGILRASIPHIEKENAEYGFNIDIGFNIHINKIIDLIRNDIWKKQYESGFFLFLAKNAFKRQSLEIAFLQCWIIWEHLFAVHNTRWLSANEIHKLNSIEKVAFLLVEYNLCDEINNTRKKRIETLTKIRNKIVHNGRFPSHDALDNAILFIRLTETIITKILELTPSNLFNTKEKLIKFLRIASAEKTSS